MKLVSHGQAKLCTACDVEICSHPEVERCKIISQHWNKA